MANTLLNPDVSKLIKVFRPVEPSIMPEYEGMSLYNAALNQNQQTITDTLTQVYHSGQPIVRLSPFPVSANPSANASATSTATKVATSIVTTAINNIPATTTLNLAQAQVDFGYDAGGEGDTATVTVTAGWVTAQSIIVCTAAGESTADHGPEDAAAEGIVAYATNLMPGLSFDIIAYAPQDTWGKYLINAEGA
jgi:hypothetical protein